MTLMSCNEDILDPDGGLDLTILNPMTTVLLYDGSTVDACGTKTYDLTGGQTYVVGAVEVSNDETNLYVTYKFLPTVNNPWFGNLHLWVGTDLATLPRNDGGAPINVQFPYTLDGETTYNNGSWIVTQYTFTIPLVEIPSFSRCGGVLYFVANAETHCDLNYDGDYDDNGETETAYAGSIAGTGSESWFLYDEFTVGCCSTTPVVTGNLKTAFAKPAIQEGGYVFVTPTLDKKTGSDTYKNNPEHYPYLGFTQNRWGWACNLAVAEDILPPALTFSMYRHWRPNSFSDRYEYGIQALQITNDEENLYVTINYNSRNIWVNTSATATYDWSKITQFTSGISTYSNPSTLTIPLNSIPSFTGFGNPFYVRAGGIYGGGSGQWIAAEDIIQYTPIQPISGTAEFPVYTGAGLNNIANGTLVGKVLVSYNGTSLKLTYDMDGGYEMEEVHIYADDAVPTKVAPGQFGFNTYFDPMVNDFETIIDVPDTNGDGEIWIILHSVVGPV